MDYLDCKRVMAILFPITIKVGINRVDDDRYTLDVVWLGGGTEHFSSAAAAVRAAAKRRLAREEGAHETH